MIKLKGIDFLSKEPRKIIKNQKKMDQIEIITILIQKIKNHKLDLKDKTENNKNFNKNTKEKNKKLKAEGLYQNILYIQIRNKGLN